MKIYDMHVEIYEFKSWRSSLGFADHPALGHRAR